MLAYVRACVPARPLIPCDASHRPCTTFGIQSTAYSLQCLNQNRPVESNFVFYFARNIKLPVIPFTCDAAGVERVTFASIDDLGLVDLNLWRF